MGGALSAVARRFAPPPEPRKNPHDLPVTYNLLAGLTLSLADPDADPPGANDPDRKVTDLHPRPVVLVHGMAMTAAVSWAALSPLLVNHGYCVFALNYGGRKGRGLKGLGDNVASARLLAGFVDDVLERTGAEQVDVVAHSQGSPVTRYYMRRFGGAEKVATLVGLSPSNHGSTANGMGTALTRFGPTRRAVDRFVPGTAQLVKGSAYLREVNEGGGTLPGVDYTVIVSKHDKVITPSYRQAFLDGPRVTNITLQDTCRKDRSEHYAVLYNRRALALTLNALDPEHPVPVPSARIRPLLGG